MSQSKSQSTARLMDWIGPPPWPGAIIEQIEDIFWETAGRPPQDPAGRQAFKHRWLTSYLSQDPEHAFVALSHPATAGTPAPSDVVGYLVGTMLTPRDKPRFANDRLFEAFAHLLPTYPAHLHINLSERSRGFGLGRMLIEQFCHHAARHAAKGVHVITGAEARNVTFYYGRVGFTEQGRTTVNGRDIVLLGRKLEHHP